MVTTATSQPIAEEDDKDEEVDGNIEDEEEGGDENVETKITRDKFFVRYAIAMGTCGPNNDEEAAASNI